MKYVLDASVALKWIFDENLSDSARALRLAAEQGQDELIAQCHNG